MSDSSKALCAFKWGYSVKAKWVRQGDCGRHLIGGRLVLLGGRPLCSRHRKTVRPGHLGYCLLDLMNSYLDEKVFSLVCEWFCRSSDKLLTFLTRHEHIYESKRASAGKIQGINVNIRATGVGKHP